MKNDLTLLRRYSFAVYCNRTQSAALDAMRRLHCELFNAAIQQRIEAWRRQRKWLKVRGRIADGNSQGAEIKDLRREFAEYHALDWSQLAATLERAEQAYTDMVENRRTYAARVKQALAEGRKLPKFPRDPFRAIDGAKGKYDPYPGFGLPKHGTGWRMELGEGARCKGGRLFIKSVPGALKLRGRLPCRPEAIRSADMCFRDGKWFVSVVVHMPPRMTAGTETLRVDFDLIDSFASVKIEADGARCPGPETIFDVVDGRIVPRHQGDTGRAPADAPKDGGERGSGITAPAGAPKDGGESGWLSVIVSGRRPADAPKDGGESGRKMIDLNSPAPADAPKDGGESGKMPAMRTPVEPADAPKDGGEDKIAALQARRDRCRRGSRKYKEMNRRKRKLERSLTRRRRENLHEWTTAIVRHAQAVTVLKPADIKEKTATGHGTERAWGAATKIKAEFNKRILRQSPGLAAQVLAYKAAEAGVFYTEMEGGEALDVGNLVVEATKANRKQRRTQRNAR